MIRSQVLPLLFPVMLVSGCLGGQAAPEIELVRVPDEGIQPVIQMDRTGTTHLIYFSGDPSQGDVYYVRKLPDDLDYSTPVRVNSQPGSVIATGTVRGANMDLDDEGRVHVAWMGSSVAEPRGPGGASPMLYTRSNDSGTAFEPQRNVVRKAVGLDGGGTVAAGPGNEIYVIWHANPDKSGEEYRRIWLARSEDGGAAFAEEIPISPVETGTCGCCGLSARVSPSGRLYVLYRGARDLVHRDMHLLTGSGDILEFDYRMLEAWELGACPMSTSDIYNDDAGPVVAWETDGQVAFATVSDPESIDLEPVYPSGSGNNRKHPEVTRGNDGAVLLAWTEGTGWQRGGTLHWQLYDAKGAPIGDQGSADGIPVWGKPAVLTDENGDFDIFY